MQQDTEKHSVKLVFKDQDEEQVRSLINEHGGEILRPRRLENSAAPAGFPTGAEVLIGFKIATAIFTTGTAAMAFYRGYNKTFGTRAKIGDLESIASKNKS